jgi:hypothetical protein
MRRLLDVCLCASVPLCLCASVPLCVSVSVWSCVGLRVSSKLLLLLLQLLRLHVWLSSTVLLIPVVTCISQVFRCHDVVLTAAISCDSVQHTVLKIVAACTLFVFVLAVAAGEMPLCVRGVRVTVLLHRAACVRASLARCSSLHCQSRC